MLSGKSEQLYVAELKVPSLFYSTSETRGEIPKPSEFGISKGYYVTHISHINPAGLAVISNITT